MGRLTQRRRIIRVTRSGEATRTSERPDTLAAEEPMELRVRGKSFVVTMRTPGHDFELCAGFLVAEGILSHPEHLRGLRYCAGRDEAGNQTYNVIDADLEPALAALALQDRRQVLTTSACGICGTTSIDSVEKSLPHQHRAAQLRVSPQTLLDLSQRLRPHQKLFEKTGGVHATGLFTGEGELLLVREDVGRHNAVDKVVGRAFLDGDLPLAGTGLQVSGRASFELVQKAALAGVELLSAVGAPSSLAADLADRAGITLVGFSRGDSMNVYTHAHRITGIQ